MNDTSNATLAMLLAGAKALDDSMQGDANGEGSRAPDGDDYNRLYGLVMLATEPSGEALTVLRKVLVLARSRAEDMHENATDGDKGPHHAEAVLTWKKADAAVIAAYKLLGIQP